MKTNIIIPTILLAIAAVMPTVFAGGNSNDDKPLYPIWNKIKEYNGTEYPERYKHRHLQNDFVYDDNQLIAARNLLVALGNLNPTNFYEQLTVIDIGITALPENQMTFQDLRLTEDDKHKILLFILAYSSGMKINLNNAHAFPLPDENGHDFSNFYALIHHYKYNKLHALTSNTTPGSTKFISNLLDLFRIEEEGTEGDAYRRVEGLMNRLEEEIQNRLTAFFGDNPLDNPSATEDNTDSIKQEITIADARGFIMLQMITEAQDGTFNFTTLPVANNNNNNQLSNNIDEETIIIEGIVDNNNNNNNQPSNEEDNIDEEDNEEEDKSTTSYISIHPDALRDLEILNARLIANEEQHKSPTVMNNLIGAITRHLTPSNLAAGLMGAAMVAFGSYYM